MLDDARADFDEPVTDGLELVLGERARLRNGRAHGRYQPESRGVQYKAHLIGRRTVTRGPIGRELGFVRCACMPPRAMAAPRCRDAEGSRAWFTFEPRSSAKAASSLGSLLACPLTWYIAREREPQPVEAEYAWWCWQIACRLH